MGVHAGDLQWKVTGRAAEKCLLNSFLFRLQAALAAEMLAESAVNAASDMLVSVRAAETAERELQVRLSTLLSCRACITVLVKHGTSAREFETST